MAGRAHSCSQNQLQSYVIDGTVSMTCFQIYLLIKNFVTTVYFQVSVSLQAAHFSDWRPSLIITRLSGQNSIAKC